MFMCGAEQYDEYITPLNVAEIIHETSSFTIGQQLIA